MLLTFTTVKRKTMGQQHSMRDAGSNQAFTVTYKSKSYQFDTYHTTINQENIIFFKTDDKEAAAVLKGNHFFMVMDITRPGLYYYNGIVGTRDETDFKNHICDSMARQYRVTKTSKPGASLN